MRTTRRLRRVSLSLFVLLLVLGGTYYFFVRQPQQACFPWDAQQLPGIVEGKTYLFVAMGHCNSVLALDTSARTVAAHVSIPGRFPHGLYVDRDHHRLYVANERSDDLAVVSLPAFTYERSIAVGAFPPDVTVAGDKIWTADFKGNSVTVIDRVTFDGATTIASPAATHFALAPDGQTVYVSNWKANAVSVIDANAATIIKVIPVGKRPNHLTFSRDGQFVYVTNYKGNSVTVIDHRAQRVVREIPVGKRPMTPIATPEALYVANIKSGSISVIDRKRHAPVATIDVGGSAQHMALVGQVLYVTNPPLQNVQVIDITTNKLTGAIFTGPSPQQIAPRYVP
ncbi:MAG: YncE family protein [Candidatus Tectomicrobia bacterium]